MAYVHQYGKTHINTHTNGAHPRTRAYAIWYINGAKHNSKSGQHNEEKRRRKREKRVSVEEEGNERI